MRAEDSEQSPIFATTCWGLVLAAGEGSSPAAQQALEQLCRTYWYPLYAYLRRRGKDPDLAQDLTQGFFERLLQRNDLSRLTQEGGRFRSFLLSALNHFVINELDYSQAQKRGGGQVILSLDETNAEDRYLREPSHSESPDRLYERQWALTLMDTAIRRLADEQAEAGKSAAFESMRPFLSQEPGPGAYSESASRLGMSTGHLAVQVHRLRERYRQLVRAAVADTVQGPLEIEEEMRHLLAALITQ
jgi:RNA polymerase sigma factor (sigma-70 family)